MEHARGDFAHVRFAARAQLQDVFRRADRELAGTWVEWVAQGWLVLRITQSGFMLGLVTALAWSPILLFGPWAGVIVDRFEKRRILLFTNVASALGALVLGVATIAGIVTLWMVVVVALLLGFVTALDNPSRHTFTLEMVGRDRLTQ
jgi:MFS family permease